MDNIDEKIHLYGTDNYVTEETGEAFRVETGSVFVFVAPLKNGKPNRRLLLCEVNQGHLIPSFSFRDSEYVNWRFILVPKDEADIVRLSGKATSVLYRKFAKTAGLESFQQEGFPQSVIEYYKRESLKDDVYIGLGKKNKPSIDIASYGVIKQAFDSGEQRIDGDDPLYRTVAYACRATSIPLIESSKVSSVCGDAVSVPNIARASRFACRKVVLEQNWFKKDCGTIIGSIEGKPENGEKCKLTPQIANTISPEAFVISRTLPTRKLSTKDIIAFGAKSIRNVDVAYVLILGLIGALIGILLPTLNQKIYDEYIPLGNYSQLIQICIVIATFMIGNLFFEMVKKLSEFRISSHVGYDLQNAVYYRIFHLPESFFREHESADLAQRLAYIAGIANTFVTSVLVSRSTLKYDKQIEKAKGEASAKLYQFLNGIEKIRMAGVEDRAAYEYLLPFAEKQTFEMSKNRFAAYRLVLSGTASVMFSMVFYLIIVRSKINISTGSFMAFNSAFGSFSAAVLGLIDGILNLYQMKPQYERIRPVIETAPEDDEGKEIPGKLRGEVSLNNIKFSYDKDGSYVLNGIDLKIAQGEYVGIVGSSGCGKSTLLKLLLGFEEPDQGQVCFDGKNLKQLDKREVRKNLGVVLQNGKLIAGSIFENITITAPSATLKDVQAVIEAVGLKSDIEQMPMGVHTVLSENSGTISGGQQQRILIARAIIAHPSILIFDEATSALDNVTQAAVCESLDKMNVTRIVVAHRLSTIKNCDRIIVLQDGKIVEQGTYTALMDQNGLFHQLAARQLVD